MVRRRRLDLSLVDQLRQRAAMGGEKEREDLRAFEELLVTALTEALVAELQQPSIRPAADGQTRTKRKRRSADEC
jgi:hypothetical protein